MSSARRPKSRIIRGVARGDMNVEKTPIFMLALLFQRAVDWWLDRANLVINMPAWNMTMPA